jgi:hypothetical protein
LAPRSFHLITSPLTAERPLPLKVTVFFLQLSHCRQRNDNLIWGKSLEENALNQCVDR